LLAFRAVQLAVEARPAEALEVCESIDRTALFALPALKLACAHAIAFGDLGQPLRAAASAEQAVRLAEASPEAAFFQSIILIVYYTEALTLGGYLAEAVTVADHADQQCADVPGTA
jgi:uncharacterized protein involved in response to NO